MLQHKGLFWGIKFFFSVGHLFKAPKKDELVLLIHVSSVFPGYESHVSVSSIGFTWMFIVI